MVSNSTLFEQTHLGPYSPDLVRPFHGSAHGSEAKKSFLALWRRLGMSRGLDRPEPT